MATCKIHNCKYQNVDGKEMCPFGHERKKIFCLIKNETSGSGWSNWSYKWVTEDEAEGKEIILSVSEVIYKKIKDETL